MISRKVFITGGTGYIGQRFIPQLLQRGHTVRALTRAGSRQKLPPGCVAVIGNALDSTTFAEKIRPADTVVHLVGVPHPSPAKAQLFREIDLASVQAVVPAAVRAGVAQFVYISVAQPAPVMRAYVQVRAECEAIIRASGLNATILRPWYVLGRGHRWPYLLLPMYWTLAGFRATRESARRLGLVTHRQMITALVAAVENPVSGVQILGVPEIRASL